MIPINRWTPFLAAMQAYAQLAYPGKGTGENQVVVYCPNGWTPQALSTNNTASHCLIVDPDQELTKLLDIVNQSYAKDLGWNDLFKTAKGKDVPIDDWRMLLTPFNDDEDGYESEEQHKKTEALEWGIVEVRTFLYEYLESANFCAKSYSEIFRQQLTPSNR